MIRHKGVGAGIAVVVALLAAARAEGGSVEQPSFVVVSHLKGSLAVNLAHVESVYRFGSEEGKPARVRLNLPGGDNKALEGAEAEQVWKTLREGAGAAGFVFVSHLGGTLGIPVHKVHSAYKAENGDVRLNYPGDPQGKTVSGAEAAEVWRRLSGAR